MIAFWIILFDLITTSSTRDSLPYHLVLQYDQEIAVNTNFTVLATLKSDPFISNRCPDGVCQVDLTLELQSESSLSYVWCQPPAFPSMDHVRFKYACRFFRANANEEPTITMIVRSQRPTQIKLRSDAEFLDRREYSVDEKGSSVIAIVEQVSARSRRDSVPIDDAVESEIDEEECELNDNGN